MKPPVRYDEESGFISDADGILVCFRCNDSGNQIAAALNERAELAKLQTILSDEATLHANILRGEVPMSRATALHIAGAGDYDELKVENAELKEALKSLIKSLDDFQAVHINNDRLQKETVKASKLLEKYEHF